ncbi:Histone-lysine N-methyltransferase, H3 lysine-79 specific [Lecanosticta acicola]|uniref:Histone-lysine N-methyltransferase, H3 lysine-79 specific n=1 Tax=Lecanosticta acicola TaxID=111012 RepID=A0AAI8YS38_9PEZI|nr:Histone-lysine N-methyltransferase, H3 lysine-79 specific [Lecanosticta acicola]
MNFSKPKTGSSQPVIRKSVVRVPVPKAASAAPHRGPDPNRFKQALDRKPAKPVAFKAPQNPARRALSSSRGVKRKSATPQPALFSDDEDESSDLGGSDSDVSRKRIKSSVSSVESSWPRRPVVSEKAFKDDTVFDIIHGADATSGVHSHKFKNPWTNETFGTTELQYPSRSQKERFELKWPKNESEDYKPMTDIIETVKTICLFYFPEELSNKYLDDDTGFGRRFNRAWHAKSTEEIIEVVEDFNTVVKSLIDDGTIRKELIKKSHLSLEWVKRILEQIYSRTVSPKVETLRAYQNGSDNVYGELLPRFCSEIFRRAKLNHEQVFVDLGSGVGNVVLQAALEVGCESWGIEMMKNPCDLAELQAKEFPARTRLWGLSAGEVNLLRGDFTENTRIGEVLKRADVVLVNNQAFTPALNDKLLSIFLDLKDGCQVVSLKPFVPVGHKIAMRNYGSHANLFVQRRFEYFSESVSWTDQSGDYYIATKDPRPLAAFMKQNNLK